jgi:hypothetical protein
MNELMMFQIIELSRVNLVVLFVRLQESGKAKQPLSENHRTINVLFKIQRTSISQVSFLYPSYKLILTLK